MISRGLTVKELPEDYCVFNYRIIPKKFNRKLKENNYERKKIQRILSRNRGIF